MDQPNAPASARPRIYYLDRDTDANSEFREALDKHGDVTTCHDLHGLLQHLRDAPRDSVALLDTATLQDSPTGLAPQLLEWRGRLAMGLVTDQPFEQYLFSLRHWGLVQCGVKRPPVNDEELRRFLCVIRDPLAGFGLIRYFSNDVEMYSLQVATTPSKVYAIERVINHFATCGFEIHELYDVRLILEEIANNAFFHAFQTAAGEEKYSIGRFSRLEPGESVRIEYGSDASSVGFSVTDNAGTLPIGTILQKLERQFNREGMFDESGRGLYLSRMLATKLAINIEARKRTQLVAIFDEHRKSDRPKPFLINYSGPDTFVEWGVDPELDGVM